VSRLPSEYRQILFSNNEVIEALNEHNQVAKQKLPRGTIASCTPVAEVEVSVRLELVDRDSGETQIAALSPELVCAALLRYCMRHSIPMPRGAAKSIQIHGDDIALIVRIKGRTGK
jgi:hypothetical protein